MFSNKGIILYQDVKLIIIGIISSVISGLILYYLTGHNNQTIMEHHNNYKDIQSLDNSNFKENPDKLTYF